MRYPPKKPSPTRYQPQNELDMFGEMELCFSAWRQNFGVFGPGCGPQGAAALLAAWQGDRAKSGIERGPAGRQAKVCAVLFLEAVLVTFCTSRGFPSTRRAGGGTRTASCWQLPQLEHGGLSPAAAPDVAALEMGAPGLPQRMLALLVGLGSTGRVCTRRVWWYGDAAESPGFLCSSPSSRAGP